MADPESFSGKAHQHLNVEIKARVDDLAPIRTWLDVHEATRVGTDTQRDTYLDVPNGRLKVREGTIEQGLIFYKRPDQAGPKPSQVERVDPGEALDGVKTVLQAALSVDVVVEKTRTIYWVDHVKVHLDDVARLGTFVELEAVAPTPNATESELRADCEHLMDQLGLTVEQLVDTSYSDMVRALKT